MLGRASSAFLVVPATQLLKEYSQGEVRKILVQALEAPAVESRQDLGQGLVLQGRQVEGRFHPGQGLISPTLRHSVMARLP